MTWRSRMGWISNIGCTPFPDSIVRRGTPPTPETGRSAGRAEDPVPERAADPPPRARREVVVLEVVALERAHPRRARRPVVRDPVDPLVRDVTGERAAHRGPLERATEREE